MPVNLTKKNISDKLLEMFYSEPIDKITVKSLAEACGITRQTFYYHFHDILEVLQWRMEQRLMEAVEETMQMDQTRDAFYEMLSRCRQDMKIINYLLDSQYRAPLEHMFIEAVQKYLQEMIIRKKLLQQVSRVDLEMTVRLYSYALTGLFFHICREDDPDIEALAVQMSRLLNGEFLMLPLR